MIDCNCSGSLVESNTFVSSANILKVNFLEDLGKSLFYDNCRNSRALIGYILSSICGQTHEFEIRATRQRARAGNSTICYRKKQIDFSFSCVCPVIDNEFLHHIVKVVCGSTRLSPRGSTASLAL